MPREGTACLHGQNGGSPHGMRPLQYVWNVVSFFVSVSVGAVGGFPSCGGVVVREGLVCAADGSGFETPCGLLPTTVCH